MSDFPSYFDTILARVGKTYLQSLRVSVLTASQKQLGPEEYLFGSEIYAHREQDILELLPMLLVQTFNALIDQGRDGDWAARVLQPLGLRVVRGSSLHSSRRAAAALLRQLEKNRYPTALCVDGPAGPGGRCKPGVLFLSRRLQRKIIPVATISSSYLTLRSSWSKMKLPFPFARIAIACGSPIKVPRQTRRADWNDHLAAIDISFLETEERAQLFLAEGSRAP